MVVLILSISSTNVFAHEIFYSGNSSSYTAIPLSWYYRLGGDAYLKINGDYLTGDYTSLYSSVVDVWQTNTSSVAITESSFSSSTVDLTTASESYWDNRYGSFYSSYYWGVCDMTSSDGFSLDSVSNVQASSKKIKYANILYSPYTYAFDDTTHIKKVMVHEIGHALGLGHPNTEYYPSNVKSVMRQGTSEGYYLPQQHDIDDLNQKY